MKFQIDFNREGIGTDSQLLEIGAVVVEEPEFSYHEIEIKDFDELEKLENKVMEIIDYGVSLIVGFDPPTIYLDKV